MQYKLSRLAAIGLVLAAASALLARQNIVLNGSMEHGEGAGATDPMIAADWTEFGTNVERSAQYNLVPSGSGHALKAFGDSSSSTVGAYQVVTGISAGQQIIASVQLFSPADDKLRGSGEAGLVVEFLDSFGSPINTQQLYVLNVNSTADTWIPATIGPMAAPSGTTKIRFTCRLKWTPGDVLGAAYWDDCQLTADGLPTDILNTDFETAGVGPGQSPAGIDNWTGFNDQEKSDDVAEHGSSSLKLGVAQPYSGLFQNMHALNDGDHLVMLAWAYHPSSDPLVGDSRAGIKLEFSANANVPGPEENLTFDENVPVNQWTLVELDTVVPPDATIARIVCIYAADAATTGEVHFDSVYVERGSQPGVNQLLNLNFSFEDGPGGANGLNHWTEFNSPDVSQARKSCFAVPPVDGTCTMRASGPAVAGVFQEITVDPNETLLIQASLYTPSFNPLAGAGLAGVKVEWAIGGVPDPVDIGGPTNTVYFDDPTDTWNPITIDYVMPAGSSAITRFVNIIDKAGSPTGTVYIDSCEAVVVNKYDGTDADGDDDQDVRDFAEFQRCFSGAGGGLGWNCLVFDSDDDGDTDADDWDYFVPRLTSP